MSLKIHIVHGPNLNMLGKREPGIYGGKTLADIEQSLSNRAKRLNAHLSLDFFQSNSEGDLVDYIQSAQGNGIIINPAAYTHTSVALRDSLLAANLPFVEVHLSNIKAREEYRHKSFFSDIARGVIYGFGPIGYELALEGLVQYLKEQE